MRIKLFRAETTALAMADIRAALGPDALILENRRAEGGVEITAALDSPEEDETFEPLPGVLCFADTAREAAACAEAVPTRHDPVQPWARHHLPAAIAQALSAGCPVLASRRLFRFEPLPLQRGMAPLILLGPPGAGKTLTVAKLATRLVLDGHKPLVITADEHRTGAVEQLAGFTRLLGLTLIAAGRPEILARALSRREGGAPVLIDAPGLDLADPAQGDLASEILEASSAIPALVIPSGIDPLEAAELADAHARLGCKHLVAARLDRRGRLGGILAAAHQADLALTEAGIGPGVVDGLEPFTPEMLASRLTSAATSPAANTAPAQPARIPTPAGAVLTAHIAAQAGVSRPVQWKTPS